MTVVACLIGAACGSSLSGQARSYAVVVCSETSNNLKFFNGWLPSRFWDFQSVAMGITFRVACVIFALLSACWGAGEKSGWIDGLLAPSTNEAARDESGSDHDSCLLIQASRQRKPGAFFHLDHNMSAPLSPRRQSPHPLTMATYPVDMLAQAVHTSAVKLHQSSGSRQLTLKNKWSCHQSSNFLQRYVIWNVLIMDVHMNYMYFSVEVEMYMCMCM